MHVGENSKVREGGFGFRFWLEWRDAGVAGIPELDRRICRVLVGGQIPDGFSCFLLFGECELEWRMWKTYNVATKSLNNFSLLFPFLFLYSFVGVIAMWAFPVRNTSFRFGEWRNWDFPVGSAISLQRRGLAYYDISKWPSVQINANCSLSFSVENDRHQRRLRLCSSSVRIRRACLYGRIWIPEWGSLAACARACMHCCATWPKDKWGGVWRGDGGQACLDARRICVKGLAGATSVERVTEVYCVSQA